MRKKVVEDAWKPKYYQGDDTIQPNHVARFYGSLLAKMLTGSRSINQMFCTREIFNAVPPIQESMPKNALEDMTSCLHYSDDWDPMGDLDWDEVYDDPKVIAPPHTARHRVKHGILEDCYIQVCKLLLLLLLCFESITNLPSFFFFFFFQEVAVLCQPIKMDHN